MCQTGYLTLRSDLNKTSTVALGIPNGEIYKALNRLLANNIFKGNTDIVESCVDDPNKARNNFGSTF